MNDVQILSYTDSKSQNAIVTLAIGSDYLKKWEKHALPTWMLYAQKHDLQILVINNHLLEISDPYWKKPQWQKLLIPEILSKHFPEIENICYLDTDILINPLAPNIFDELVEEKVSSVSLRSGLPFDREEVYKKLALLRKTYIDDLYPLDSALFISLENLYEYHDLIPQEDEFCSGVLLFNVKKFKKIMKKWFYAYAKDIDSITNGGEQTHLNFHVLNEGHFNKLDYKWQAIWSYEAAWKYPFLFKLKFKDYALVNECIKNSLFDNYFLHFASKWSEANLWSEEVLDISEQDMNFYRDYSYFKNRKFYGIPVGYVTPKNSSQGKN